MHILYVEDNLINLALMERVTNTRGYEITSCTTAEDAVDVLEKLPVDIIITDIRLAGTMDGISFTHLLRKNGIECPILVTTAYEAMYSRADAIEAGCDEFLTKPLSVRKILSVLAHYENAL